MFISVHVTKYEHSDNSCEKKVNTFVELQSRNYTTKFLFVHYENMYINSRSSVGYIQITYF